ncbi:MAG: hypothetical protein IKS32_06710 [Solobacterium sp.]|nr:hypothetical protein [Solobacterium sp.]
MTERKPESLYERIRNSTVNGELPKEFSLPSPEGEEWLWADGAFDGVALYHTTLEEPDDETIGRMGEALRAAGESRFEEADVLFQKVGKRIPPIALFDTLQSYILSHEYELDPNVLFQYAVHLLRESADRNLVKFGFCIIELISGVRDDLMDVIRTLGLSDEFTLFASRVMADFPDANHELFQLAQKVHGWGRIHLSECIKPENEEIRKWFLLDAVHNDVMPVYSALTCWEKSDAASVLKRPMSREERNGIRDILLGMLDEGPVPGISLLGDRESVILKFLGVLRREACEQEDVLAVKELHEWVQSHGENQTILTACRILLDQPRYRQMIREAELCKECALPAESHKKDAAEEQEK